MNSQTNIGVVLDDVKKTYRGHEGPVAAMDGFTLRAEPGEFMVLLGPSGCGKTTALRSVAGLETIDGGRIMIGDRVVSDGTARGSVPPHRRGLGMVFQSYALWPHMSVFDNVAYPLRNAGRPRREDLRSRVMLALELVQCGRLATRLPSQLSGGQQQRVALARAIVGRPGVVLFDEPLSNLDAKLREDMRFRLRELHQELGFTAVYVTHDQTEALSLGSKLAVVSGGKVVQSGTPDEVYREPRSPFVAEFLAASNRLELSASDGLLRYEGSVLGTAPPSARGASMFELRFRPADVELAPTPQGHGGQVCVGTGVISSILPEGEVTDVRVVLGSAVITAKVRSGSPVSPGNAVSVAVPVDRCHLYADGQRCELQPALVDR